MNSSVWERSGFGTMSKNLFVFATCFFTALGVGATMFASLVSQTWGLNIPFLLAVLVIGIIGVVIAIKSDNPIISLTGYMMVAIPFGLMLGPIVAMYTEASVARVFFVTTAMVVALGIVGAVIPDSLEGLGSYLFAGLIALLVGYFIIPIAGIFGLPIQQALNIWDGIGILIFAGYVVYDLNRAMRIPYTLDNAIDSALAIYLDWVNIFIRLLELTGKKKD